MKPLNEQIICKDGTNISIQASTFHYCVPRNDIGPYTHVEVGFPSVVPQESMLEYCEDIESPTDTVYGFVPIEIVKEFLEIHGGIEKGKLP